MLHRWVLCTALLLALGASAQARSLQGVVTHVSDGDTLWVRPPGAGTAVQVRLQDIDAPEICQPFGTTARNALAARVLHRRVQVTVRARDVYQRAVGRVTLQGQDLGAWLVAGGHAWAAGWQRTGPYSREELSARNARRGLWTALAPMAPWIFRQRHGSCR